VTHALPPPGWYLDPAQPQHLVRWWNGSAWTDHTGPAAPQATAPAPAAAAAAAAAAGPATYGAFTVMPAPTRREPGRGAYALRANPRSRAVFVIEAVYILLAAFTGFFLIGFLPLVLSVRAITAREQLGPFALAFTVVGFVVSVALAAHHHRL